MHHTALAAAVLARQRLPLADPGFGNVSAAIMLQGWQSRFNAASRS
jgi:hypothetical protein